MSIILYIVTSSPLNIQVQVNIKSYKSFIWLTTNLDDVPLYYCIWTKFYYYFDIVFVILMFNPGFTHFTYKKIIT